VHCETWLLGTGSAVQRRQAWVDKRHWWMSECGRDLYWLHDAWLSRQVHAVYEPTTGFITVVPRGDDLWESDPRFAKVHSGVVE